MGVPPGVHLRYTEFDITCMNAMLVGNGPRLVEVLAAERLFAPNSFGGIGSRLKEGDRMAEISIRPAQAADAAGMSALIGQFAEQNLMLPRSAAQILRALPEFLVAVETTDAPDGVGAVSYTHLTLPTSDLV